MFTRKIFILPIFFLFFSSNAQEVPNLQMQKIFATYSSIGGCMTSITDSSVAGYMHSAQAKGKPFKNFDEAKADMTSAPAWKKGIEPGIYGCCKEILEPFISKINSASSENEINSEAQRFYANKSNRLSSPENQQKLESCMADSMQRAEAFMNSLEK